MAAHKSKAKRRFGARRVRTRVGAICLLSTTFLVPTSTALGGMAEGLAAYQSGDYAAAYAEWLPLARDGDAAAQRNLAQLYRLGQGVPRNPAVAANWYRLAAEQGLARAQSNLAAMYLQGDGVAKDAVAAADWLRRAATQGHAQSQFNLGLMYERGIGLDADAAKARNWYEQAADAGHTSAQEQLAGLETASVENETADAGTRAAPPVRSDLTRAEISLHALRSQRRVPDHTDRPAAGLALPPDDPDARDAELTASRLAVVRALRERIAVARKERKTKIPPPPFAGARPQPLPEFLRQEVKEETVASSNKSLPPKPAAAAEFQPVQRETLDPPPPSSPDEIQVAELPIPEFLVRKAAEDGTPLVAPAAGDPTEVAAASPIPEFLVREAAEDGTPLVAPAAADPTEVAAELPIPEFLVREAAEDGTPLVAPAAADPTEVAAELPIPEFLVREAAEDGTPLVAPAAGDPVGEIERPSVNYVLVRSKRLPDVLKREAEQDRATRVARRQEPASSAPIAADLGQEPVEPLPVTTMIGAAGNPVEESESLRTRYVLVRTKRLPEFLEREVARDRTTQVARRLEPASSAPIAGELPQDRTVVQQPVEPVPVIAMLEAATGRASQLADASVAPAPAGALELDDAAEVRPAPRFLRKEAKEMRVATLALRTKPQLLPPRLEDDDGTPGPFLDLKPIPDILVEEARETRRSLVFDLARSLRGTIRPPRKAPVIAALEEPRPVPEFLRHEAAHSRLTLVNAVVVSRVGGDASEAAAAAGYTPQSGQDDEPAVKPVPEFLVREAREEKGAALAPSPAPAFLKAEAALDAKDMQIPSFLIREAKAQTDATGRVQVKPVPSFLRREALYDRWVRSASLSDTRPSSVIAADAATKLFKALPVLPPLKLEAALEAKFVNAYLPPPFRVRALLPAQVAADTPSPKPLPRPPEPKTAVLWKASVRELDLSSPWLVDPQRDNSLVAQVVEQGVRAYTARDYATAHDLWLGVARRGDANAQFYLGALYADGAGVPSDLGHAYSWWRLSGDQGHSKAKEFLATLRELMDEHEVARARDSASI